MDTLQILASYVPALLVRRLATGVPVPEPDQPQRTERLVTAALFVDISGYTGLTERLGRHGKSGIEALSGVLNAFFGRLIELVRSHGGDVVKFAGDALLVLWPVGQADGGLSTALVRASACALEIQKLLHDHEIAPGVRLSLRVGVGGGEVIAGLVGGARGRAELFVVGGAIIEAASAQQAAPRGGVALSPGAWALLRSRARGQPQPGGGAILESVEQGLVARPLVLPTLSGLVEASLRAFVPGVVRARLDAGISGFEAELRRVAVVFVNLPTLTAARADRAHTVISALQEDLYRYEGSLHHLSVDDKGPTLVGAFGLPPLAHEDDPARAVLAALDIRTSLAELGEKGGVGVATGEVYCGSVGHPRRREYTLIGETVVRAARLMVAAGDGIYTDEATQERARDRVKFEDKKTIKGKQQQIDAFRPYVRRRLVMAQEGTAHALVGRTREREILRNAASDLVTGGSGGVIILEAEHGYGKSHLSEDLVAHARQVGLEVLRGAADTVERATPYYAWRRVLARELLAGASGGDSMVMQASLLQRITRDAEMLPLAPLLNTLLPMGLPENETTRQLSGEARVAATRDLILRLVASHAGGRPLLVVLEDVHWMDSASWALALAAVRRMPALLLVLTTRPPEGHLSPAHQELRRREQTLILRLGPLSPEEVAALLCQQLDVDRVPRAVLDLVYQRASGHPQFSVEVALALRDAGVISVKDGICRLESAGGDLARLELPETVQGLVRGRIDQLPPQSQLALKVASVVGRVFTLRLLREVFPAEGERANLHLHLEPLLRGHLIERVAGAPELTYSFRDAVTQEVASGLMLQAQRRTLHRAIAQRYEEVHPAELSRYHALLAWHWSEAGEPAAALPWLERAGEQALASGAWGEAAAFYTEALRRDAALARAGTGLDEPPLAGPLEAWPSASPLGVRARLERQRGLALVHAGKTEEGRQSLLAAVARADRPLALGGLARLRALAGVLLGLPRRVRDPKAAIQAVLAYEVLTELAWFNLDADTAALSLLRGFALARALGPSPELSRASASLALCLSAVPLPRLVRRALDAAWRSARAAGDTASGTWIAFVEGQISLGLGRWDDALAAFGRAEAAWRAASDHLHLARCLHGAAHVRLFRGELGAAMTGMRAVEQTGERGGDATFVAAGLRGRALVHVRAGEPDAALPLLERARALSLEGGSRLSTVATLGEHALALWRANRKGEAQSDARQVAEVLQGVRPTAIGALTGVAGATEVLTLAHEEAAALGHLYSAALEEDTANHALQAYGRIWPIARPSAMLMEGRRALRRGAKNEAIRAWEAGLAAATRLGMPWEAAALHTALAQHGPEPARAEHRAAAARLSGQLRLFDDEATVLRPRA